MTSTSSNSQPVWQYFTNTYISNGEYTTRNIISVTPSNVEDNPTRLAQELQYSINNGYYGFSWNNPQGVPAGHVEFNYIGSGYQNTITLTYNRYGSMTNNDPNKRHMYVHIANATAAGVYQEKSYATLLNADGTVWVENTSSNANQNTYSGELRFSAIASSIFDYNNTPIKLSYYFADNVTIDTTNLKKFNESGQPVLDQNGEQVEITFPNSDDLDRMFRISKFYGAQKVDDVPSPSSPPSPKETEPFPKHEGGLGLVTYEWAQGLNVINVTGTSRNPNNANNNITYRYDTRANEDTDPSTILQAKSGDKIKVTTFQHTGDYLQYVIIWLYDGTKWEELDVETTTKTETPFTREYEINLVPGGNYAIGMSLNYYWDGKNGPAHRSWRAFSLHVWG